MIHERILQWMKSNPFYLARMSVFMGYLSFFTSIVLVLLTILALLIDVKSFALAIEIKRFRFFGEFFISGIIFSLMAIILAGTSKQFSDDDEKYKQRWTRGVILGFVTLFVLFFAAFLAFFFGIPVMLSNL